MADEVPRQFKKWTAECEQCNRGDPVVYDTEWERDNEAQQHANKTGHILAVGWIDTRENQ